MRRFVLLALLSVAAAALAAEDAPYPPGSTSQHYAGLRFQLVVPKDWNPEKEYSLIVILHGMGDNEMGMSHTFQSLAEDGFVVCTPKSTGDSWSAPDIKAVKEIVEHLKETMSIGKGRLHGVGFSNGGWNLDPLVFDDKLHFVSACWIAAGCRGGKVPKWARREMGVLALAGAQDGNRGAAEKTVDMLEDKVRTVEVRIQENLGHAFPNEHLPYLLWWVKVMEGRYVPGDDLSFDWTTDLDAARKKMAAGKKGTGGFGWFWSAKDTENEEAKRVQHEVFFDPFVRRFGRQLVCVKLEREKHGELFDSLKLDETPAVVVWKPDGKVVKKLEGKKIKPMALAKALRSVARDKSIPR